MTDPRQPVSEHYGVGGVLDSILDALVKQGKDLSALVSEDLAPVDEFHIRGREATVELAGLAGITPGLLVLDVGCGLGGSVRHLAAEYRCEAVGVDLTPEYVAAAKALAKLVGLDETTRFYQGSALELPLDDDSYDVVWTQHVQMNIEDKERFYSEIARVLKPGGRLAFHDIFRGTAGSLRYPVPWAGDESISHLASEESLRLYLERAGLEILDWQDKSQPSLDWITTVMERRKGSGTSALGTHLLMGPDAGLKFQNMARNLREGKIVVIQAVARKA